jgi:hypothetical protein
VDLQDRKERLRQSPPSPSSRWENPRSESGRRARRSSGGPYGVTPNPRAMPPVRRSWLHNLALIRFRHLSRAWPLPAHNDLVLSSCRRTAPKPRRPKVRGTRQSLLTQLRDKTDQRVRDRVGPVLVRIRR